jgi:hypothetical protein
MASVGTNNDFKQKNKKICGQDANIRATYNSLRKNRDLERVRTYAVCLRKKDFAPFVYELHCVEVTRTHRIWTKLCCVHPCSFGIGVYVPSADVVCATKYSGGYPAVLGYYLPLICFVC